MPTARLHTVLLADAQQLPGLQQALLDAPCDIDAAVAREPHLSLKSQLPAAIPELLIVELAGDGRADLAQIENLVARHPSCPVIALAPQASPDLLRAAMRCGVRELLELPLQPDALAAAVRQLHQRQQAAASASAGRAAAFISASGGRSATVLACNVAALLAAEHALRTLVIDLDPYYADASYLLGEQRPSITLQDLARNVGRLDGHLLQASLAHVSPRLDLLAQPADARAVQPLQPADLHTLLDTALHTHEVVVFEVARQLDSTALAALERASQVYLLTEALLPFMRDTRRLAQRLGDAGIDSARLRLVLNRFDRAGDVTPREVEAATGLPIAHTLPAREDEVRESLNAGLMLAEWRGTSPLVRALRQLADEIAGQPSPRAAPWFDRLLGRRAVPAASSSSHATAARRVMQ